LSFGEIQADPENQIVLRGGDRVRLTSMEFRLLLYLLRNRNRALTRRQILNSVWGCKEPGETRTLETFVKRLRQKLEAEPGKPRHFVTVHGVGYQFVTHDK
jgi:DNA-binding response OmpR family regulator